MPSADWKVEIVDSSGEADYSVTVIGDQVVDLTGATDGEVLTVQSDGTVAPEAPGIPGAHASTHEDGGSDEVELAQSQITGLVTDLAGKASTSHHATHEPGGADLVVDPDDITTGESVYERRNAHSSAVATGTQNIRLTYFTARKTGTYTQLRAACGGTAHTLASLVKFAVFSVAGNGDLTCIGVTANDTALLATQNTEYTKATTASFDITAGQRYAFGVLVVTAGVAPTLIGQNIALAAIAFRAPALSGNVAGQADMPAVSGTIAAGSVANSGASLYGELVP